jgi:hypothetical protein
MSGKEGVEMMTFIEPPQNQTCGETNTPQVIVNPTENQPDRLNQTCGETNTPQVIVNLNLGLLAK